MTIRSDILQALRGWLKAASTLTDAQVIPADDKGPRPSLPYLTVKVTAADLPIGEDEQVRSLDDDEDPTVLVSGARRATASIQAYGAAAEAWLVAARLALRLPAMQQQLNAAGISVVPLGSIRDISGLVDTSIEFRGVWDLDVLYGVASDPAAEVAAAIVQLTSVLESYEDDPSPRTVITTIDL